MSGEGASGDRAVLQVTEAGAGGVLRHLDHIIPALGRAGCRCAVLVFSARADRARLEESFAAWRRDGVEARFLALPAGWLRRPGCWRRIRRELRSLVREFRPGVVHLHSSLAGGVGRLLLPTCGFSGRVLYSPHAFAWHPEMGWRRRTAAALAERLLAPLTDRYVLVGPGELEQADAMGLACRDKADLVPNGLPEDFADGLLTREEARRRLGIPGDVFAAVVPGRLAWQKGQAGLLRRLDSMDLPEGCRFHFCGEGVRRLEGMPGLGTHRERWRFLGDVRGLDRCLPAFDLGILPSRYEGFSYALLEMLAAGLPVLATDLPANRLVRKRIDDPSLRLLLWRTPGEFGPMLRRCLAWTRDAAAGRAIPRVFSLRRQAEDLRRIYTGTPEDPRA